ncbi:ANTAR domain-containing protein [Streptomyces flavofungini]|uniref:ANTAR domain-containing protein n=1 Tax=Streptomyces flavofungini TaxID=68200 RepID=UPI0034DE54D0
MSTDAPARPQTQDPPAAATAGRAAHDETPLAAAHPQATMYHAIGVLLVLGRLTPEEARSVLRTISQRTNTKLRDVATLLVQWARSGDLRADIRSELARQLRPRPRGGTAAPRG